MDAGFLDSVVEPEELVEAALAEAKRLAALPQPAFGRTKAGLRGEMVAALRASLVGDMARLNGPSS